LALTTEKLSTCFYQNIPIRCEKFLKKCFVFELFVNGFEKVCLLISKLLPNKAIMFY
jgi:hypothetical protein